MNGEVGTVVGDSVFRLLLALDVLASSHPAEVSRVLADRINAQRGHKARCFVMWNNVAAMLESMTDMAQSTDSAWARIVKDINQDYGCAIVPSEIRE